MIFSTDSTLQVTPVLSSAFRLTEYSLYEPWIYVQLSINKLGSLNKLHSNVIATSTLFFLCKPRLREKRVLLRWNGLHRGARLYARVRLIKEKRGNSIVFYQKQAASIWWLVKNNRESLEKQGKRERFLVKTPDPWGLLSGEYCS